MKVRRKIQTYFLVFTLIMTILPTQLFAEEIVSTPTTMETNLPERQITTPEVININPNIYVGDGYEVEFKVTNQWEGAFNGELILKNTGEKALENWTLKFDFGHEITNIWNSQIVSHEGTSYLIKNLGWNQDVASGSSISIGFQANCTGYINPPKNYDLLIADQEVNNTDYTIKFKVLGDWEQAFNGEISIKNNTDKPIEDWTLEFDFNRNIEKFWEAEIKKHEGNHYIIKNAGYNANIAPGQTLVLGFEGNPGKVDNEPCNYKLNQIGQEIDFAADTDGDGIPDYIEKIIGTQIDNSDSDNDGLPDPYEYFLLKTNPLKLDTDNNGVSDCDEDSDNDKLTNLEEYKLKTNIFSNDSDEDGLLDGEEVHEYETDPLKPDTDGDTLLDKEEINIGLKPTDMYTFGVLDSEYIIKQHIDSSLLTNITQDVYKLDIELDAAGDARSYFDVRDSEQSNVLSGNRAIVGEPVGLFYERKINNMKLTYQINQSYVNDEEGFYSDDKELQGLKRYQIFRYDKEYDTLCPVVTEYDVDNNKIYTETTELGTYCVIDLEKWFYDLGIRNTEVSEQTTSSNIAPVMLSKNNLVKPTLFQTNANTKAGSINTPVELVFIIDVTGSMDERINHIKEKIKSMVSELYDNKITVRVAAVTYNDYFYSNGKMRFDTTVKELKIGNGIATTKWATTPQMAKELIDLVGEAGGSTEPYLDGLSVALSDLDYSKGAMKYFVLFTDEPGCLYNSGGFGSPSIMADTLDEQRIITSVVTLPSLFNSSTFVPLYSTTQGICSSINGEFWTDIKNLILTSTKNSKQFTVLNPASMTSITLEQYPKQGSSVNSDNDSLSDSQEINWNRIQCFGDTPILPTMGEYLKEIRSNYGDIFSRLEVKYQTQLKSTPILPIKSDPSSEDGDGDGLFDDDKNEKEPLIFNPYSIEANKAYSAYITKDKYLLYCFSPSTYEGGYYDIYSSGNADANVEIFTKKNGKYKRIGSNNDSGNGKNFKLEVSLDPTQLYYIKVTSETSGKISINVDEHQEIMYCPEGGLFIPDSNKHATTLFFPGEAAEVLLRARQDSTLLGNITRLAGESGASAAIGSFLGISSVGSGALAGFIVGIEDVGVSWLNNDDLKDAIEKTSSYRINEYGQEVRYGCTGIQISCLMYMDKTGMFTYTVMYDPWDGKNIYGPKRVKGKLKPKEYDLPLKYNSGLFGA